MKVRDVDSWQGRRAALTQDGEIGQAFLKFVEAWAVAAEKILPGYDPAAALERTLSAVEDQQGRADIFWLGQLMAVMAEHWEHGEEMMNTVSPVVRRLIEDMTLLKMIDEMQKAETHGGNVDQNGGAHGGPLIEMPGVQPAGRDSASPTGPSDE